MMTLGDDVFQQAHPLIRDFNFGCPLSFSFGMAIVASTAEPLVTTLPLVFVIHLRFAVIVTMRATELFVVRGLVTLTAI